LMWFRTCSHQRRRVLFYCRTTSCKLNLRFGELGEVVKRLDGRTILVVEDEPLVGLDIADSLRSAGATVVSSRSVSDALAQAATAELSAAVLDINLVGEDCSLICQQLTDRGIPFVFHTGYTVAPVLEKWPDAPILRKPSVPGAIINALASLFE